MERQKTLVLVRPVRHGAGYEHGPETVTERSRRPRADFDPTIVIAVTLMA
jgi:hypothetical protein